MKKWIPTVKVRVFLIGKVYWVCIGKGLTNVILEIFSNM